MSKESTIQRHGNAWDHRNGSFITYDPKKREKKRDPYFRARLGDEAFWCEDKFGYLYNFKHLLQGDSDAPSYMRSLAKRVHRDIKADEKLEGGE